MSAIENLDGSHLHFTTATLEDLTSRELEVLKLVTHGLSNNQIAERLHLSINSIKTYIRIVYRKIGAETRSHGIIWGVQHGLLDGTKNTDTDQDVDSVPGGTKIAPAGE